MSFTISSALAKHSPSSSCTAMSVKRILQFVLYNFPFLYFYFSSVSARLNESSPSAKLNAASRSQHIADPCQRFSQRVAFLLVLPTGFPHATHDVTANTQAASCGFSLTGQLTSGNSQIQQLATCNWPMLPLSLTDLSDLCPTQIACHVSKFIGLFNATIQLDYHTIRPTAISELRFKTSSSLGLIALLLSPSYNTYRRSRMAITWRDIELSRNRNNS